MNLKLITACLRACLFFITFCHFSFAEVIKDEHFSTGSNSYSWKSVCKQITKRDSPLIEKKTASLLDCMGESVEIEKFCDEKEIANAFYTRAYINSIDKTVECKSGRRVIFKWKCEGLKDKYCEDQETGCYLIQEKLAKRLKIIHKSLIKEGEERYLNCYFGSKNLDLKNL